MSVLVSSCKVKKGSKMKKVIVGVVVITLVLVGYIYLSKPYRGCTEVSVGSGFVAGYGCDGKTIYIPR